MTVRMRIAMALGLGLALTASAQAATLRGVVTDQATREPLAGATVVVTAEGVGETAITEEDGSFTVDVPAGSYLVTYYFGDTTVERRDVLVGDASVTELQQPIDTTQREIEWGCDFGPPPLYTGVPSDRTDRDPDDVPLLRVLDHHALAGLDARLVPRHAVTTIGGVLRLPGAPAIATEFLDLLATTSTAAAIASPGATGGTLDATLVHGTNEHTGGAALHLGPDARFVARHGAPIEDDHLWWSAGVVLERTSGEGGASGRHGGQLLGTLEAQTDPDEAELGVAWLTTWAPDGSADLWVDSHVRLRGDDNQRELRIGLSAESLTSAEGSASTARAGAAAAGPAEIDRLAGRLMLIQHRRWHGHHTVAIGGELGVGDADDVEHGDLRAFVGDEWSLRPNWTVTGGVRWERRELGPARIDAVLPRLTVAWDPTKEGARMWFATAERVAALDQDQFGGWRTATAVGADQASLGYTRDWLDDDLRVTLAARARRAIGVDAAPIERGAEVAMRWLPRRRFAGELTASSLTRRMVAQASYAVTHTTTTTVAAVAEVGEDEHHWGTSLTWAVPDAVGPGLDLRVALALFDLDVADTRGGRLAMSADW